MKNLVIVLLLIVFLPPNRIAGKDMNGSPMILDSQSKDVKIKYEIKLSIDSMNKDFPKFIEVLIKNSGEKVKLRNFLIAVYYDDGGFGGFWCFSNNFRFLENDLILQKGQILKKIFYLDSLDYKDFKSKKDVDFEYVRKKLTGSKNWSVGASLQDKRLLENPYNSSDMVTSNLIKIINK